MYIHINLVRIFSVRIYIHLVYVYVGMYTHTLNIHTGRTSRTTQPSESIFEKKMNLLKEEVTIVRRLTIFR